MEPFSTSQAIAGGAYEVATIINKSNEKFSSEVWAKPLEDPVGCGLFGGGMDARRAYEILERSLERSFVFFRQRISSRLSRSVIRRIRLIRLWDENGQVLVRLHASP
uniref:Uncharacterized protein n=1 Tax=Coccidioides posadasii RMSCC 3488 TaxID=454284 RepID=A0A0J6FV78_COCPO|nr:hypothetical protein CPAG_09348 [Coccidioides posadasii RMSCC 3488]